jgi:hypothetical protein
MNIPSSYGTNNSAVVPVPISLLSDDNVTAGTSSFTPCG